ncbi:MarR family transcriptional regulator [Patescibacteria group bacterium]|nr:MarR family transcriptional regulator [Patescibacteria group bacterium]MCL5409358.1 MarR family transcriptional regulator [Patescibacteria group bacterium]
MKNQSLNDQLIELIFSFASRIKGKMSHPLGQTHLTLHQLHVLMYIAQHDFVRVVDLAQNFKTTLPTMTSLVDRLAGDNLVTRERSRADRREVIIRLSKKAQRQIEKATIYRAKMLNEFLEFIPESDKKHLLRIIKNLSEAVK